MSDFYAEHIRRYNHRIFGHLTCRVYRRPEIEHAQREGRFFVLDMIESQVLYKFQ